jgi:hypothetical protein|tara:strand:+ start:223 stop:858 length:636 start_codon:yes stop_codon:yes gene_type:complete
MGFIMKMRTTNNWFDKGAKATWEKHLLPLKDRVDSYLEIGVMEGQSMRWILENLQPTKAVGVDPWVTPRDGKEEAYAMFRDNAFHNLRGWLLEDDFDLKLIELSSWQAFTGPYIDEDIPDNSFDLAYVDGSHWGNHAMEDMMHVWRKLKSGKGRKERLGGGIMVVDDIHRRWHRGRALVRPAVEAFRLAYDGLYSVLYEVPHQVAFIKHMG